MSTLTVAFSWSLTDSCGRDDTINPQQGNTSLSSMSAIKLFSLNHSGYSSYPVRSTARSLHCFLQRISYMQKKFRWLLYLSYKITGGGHQSLTFVVQKDHAKTQVASASLKFPVYPNNMLLLLITKTFLFQELLQLR